jgi:hypothetical protein
MQLDKKQRDRYLVEVLSRKGLSNTDIFHVIETLEAFEAKRDETVDDQYQHLAESRGSIKELVAWTHAKKESSVKEVNGFLRRVFWKLQ